MTSNPAAETRYTDVAFNHIILPKTRSPYVAAASFGIIYIEYQTD
jgi:hypothetical protein